MGPCGADDAWREDPSPGVRSLRLRLSVASLLLQALPITDQLPPRHGILGKATPSGGKNLTWQVELSAHAPMETLHLPSMWDLSDINIDLGAASAAAGKPTTIEVHAAPNQQVRGLWRDSSGRAWRIPHDWRKRRVLLPAYGLLLENNVPPDVAEEFAGKAVSVNYHPGSLCCLPDGYRFRDGQGGRWPIRAIDCLLLGYGDRNERLA